MRVLLRDIVNSIEQMDRLFSGHTRAKDGFALALVRREIAPILEEYQRSQEKLLNEYATRDEARMDRYHFLLPQTATEKQAGNERVLDFNAIDAYAEEHDELLSSEVEITSTVSIAQIDKAKIDPALTPDELASLWWLIADFRDDAE